MACAVEGLPVAMAEGLSCARVRGAVADYSIGCRDVRAAKGVCADAAGRRRATVVVRRGRSAGQRGVDDWIKCVVAAAGLCVGVARGDDVRTAPQITVAASGQRFGEH